MSLAIDYSYARPNPTDIASAGYVAVLRYLSGAPQSGKDLTSAEASALHSAGLAIGLVWETTGTDYTNGFAQGAADGTSANAEADALGYPSACPIFYAIDTDVSDPATVLPYFQGLQSAGGRTVKAYGSDSVIDYLATQGFGTGWQTEAWSGAAISSNAVLYQRVTPTLTIAGTAPGDYDEDAILGTMPWWEPDAPVPSTPPPTPVITGDAMQRTTISFTADDNGNGWVLSPVSPDVQIVSIVPTNADPPEIGGYVKVPIFAGITANNVLVFEGGQPNGTFGYYVWSVT